LLGHLTMFVEQISRY